MSNSNFTSPLQYPWVYFMIAVIPTLAAFTLYGINIIQWRNNSDFGWRAMYESGPNVAADIFDRARAAGLRTGDKIVAINGKKYSTFEELFFQVRNEKPGSVNIYTVIRDGNEVKISIATGRLGLSKVLRRSGPLFFLGFTYFMIGALVFLMKPRDRVSWLFLVQTSFFGLMICYQSPSDLMRPLWLFDVRNFIEIFMPAPMMHLALRFPKTRTFIVKQPWLVAAPYLIAFILFVVMRMNSIAYWNIPPSLNHIYNLFIMSAVLVFLASVVWNFFRDPSAAVRIQSQAILVGIFIGFFIPVVDLVVRSYLNIYLFPDPVIGFVAFLTAFPLSIGFTIVKYDLFAIDTIIRRTYGYLLTTGTISGIYAAVITILNLAFGQFEVTRSPAFPVIFILAVVLFFNPVRNKVQRFIDRTFYRLDYDYQKTVQKISTRMRTLLNLDEIGKAIMETALETMFIDSGCVVLRSRNRAEYECLIPAGQKDKGLHRSEYEHSGAAELDNPEVGNGDTQNMPYASVEIRGSETESNLRGLTIAGDDPLIRRIAEQQKAVTIYDIEEDPAFDGVRDACRKVFELLEATLLVPLIYEKQLTGMISLGRKKSGKFYRREDILLLDTLANQASVAIENAYKLEEIIEKERLKTKIMDAFGKYVTQEIRDQILEGQIPLDGETKDVTVLFADLRDFTTLAESNPAKEVVKIINGYFSEMSAAIRRHNGLVLQFIGDEIEAVFGAPLALENHPTHAVEAALEMHERMTHVNARLQKQGYRPLRHGIGLHTGKVVAANIGSDDRLSYALVGDTVNIASRVQGLNKKFSTEILMTATTRARLLNGNVPVEKLPATTVKGKREPVEIYKII